MLMVTYTAQGGRKGGYTSLVSHMLQTLSSFYCTVQRKTRHLENRTISDPQFKYSHPLFYIAKVYRDINFIRNGLNYNMDQKAIIQNVCTVEVAYKIFYYIAFYHA
jgi:hypothetical protein